MPANSKTIVINGKNFSNLEGFYGEIDRVLTKDLEWQTGHNMNALNDLLRGGFGVFEYEEPIRLIWNSSADSKIALGSDMFDHIVKLIREHSHIELSLE